MRRRRSEPRWRMNRRRRPRTLAELHERAKRRRARELAAMKPLERLVFVELEAGVQARMEREVLYGAGPW